MKIKSHADGSFEKRLSRRKFVGQGAAMAMAFSIVPRHVLGGPGFVPPSDKVNIAFIGVGSQGLRVMLHFLKEPDVQGVAVCDPNKSSADHPQWDTHEFCKSVRSLLGVDTGWDWLSPDQPIQLTHSLRVTSGVAERRRPPGNTAVARRIAITANCSRNKKVWMQSWCARRTICTRRCPRRR